jgi:hypothetical protein
MSRFGKVIILEKYEGNVVDYHRQSKAGVQASMMYHCNIIDQAFR